MVTIFIPTPLRRFTGDNAKVKVTASNVAEAIRSLINVYPTLSTYIYDEGDLIRKHVRIYLGENDIREQQDTLTPLKDGDELSIIPAIAGGSKDN